jgi:hypothetical protein
MLPMSTGREVSVGVRHASKEKIILGVEKIILGVGCVVSWKQLINKLSASYTQKKKIV